MRCAFPLHIGAQQVGVTYAARVAYAVEELEDLNGALAAKASGISEGAGFHFTIAGLRRDVSGQGCQLIHAGWRIEQVLDDLKQQALA